MHWFCVCSLTPPKKTHFRLHPKTWEEFHPGPKSSNSKGLESSTRKMLRLLQWICARVPVNTSVKCWRRAHSPGALVVMATCQITERMGLGEITGEMFSHVQPTFLKSWKYTWRTSEYFSSNPKLSVKHLVSLSAAVFVLFFPCEFQLFWLSRSYLAGAAFLKANCWDPVLVIHQWIRIEVIFVPHLSHGNGFSD